jgi:hypothetical protein
MINIHLPDRKLWAQQKFLGGVWLCILSVLPMHAQTISDSAAHGVSAAERLALVDLSGNALTLAQSQAMAAALAQVCREENNFEVATETALAAYLENYRHFSVLAADSVRALCQDLGIDYLIAFKLESVAPVDLPAAAWQITLRWLDGGTGQMTKTLTRECSGDVNVPESLPLRDLLRALVESPEVILPVDNLLVEMPALSTPEVAADSAATSTPALQNRRGRHWLWYFTGAAVLGGGSAVLLLRKSSNDAPTAKTLLPNPPDPPK